MDNQKILKIFQEKKAILNGHFLLTSGLHSSTYIQCSRILEDPKVTSEMSKLISENFKGQKIDLVLSPAIGGIIWGYALAEILNCKHVFAEREDGHLVLRRGFDIEKGRKVLIAEDVVTTGGSVKELIEICQQAGADIVGLAAMVDRSEGLDGVNRVESLLKIDAKTYLPEECPYCKQGTPIEKPGSKMFGSA